MIDGIYILLGSNLADKISNLERAQREIEKRLGPIAKRSAIYESDAWGKEDQPVFFNQVLEVSSDLTPFEMIKEILSIEKDLGRIRLEKWGERIIDIDILYYSHTTIDNQDLTIPHPGIPDRRFTLVPLCEIAPQFVHPILKKTNEDILSNCTDPLGVKKIRDPEIPQ